MNATLTTVTKDVLHGWVIEAIESANAAGIEATFRIVIEEIEKAHGHEIGAADRRICPSHEGVVSTPFESWHVTLTHTGTWLRSPAMGVLAPITRGEAWTLTGVQGVASPSTATLNRARVESERCSSCFASHPASWESCY